VSKYCGAEENDKLNIYLKLYYKKWGAKVIFFRALLRL
jgi:hypothetical protein